MFSDPRNLTIAAVSLALSCAPNYSNGSRAGVVTKLSQKGCLFKSWEGEMRVAVPGTMAAPETWDFNVDESAAREVERAVSSGDRVELVYRQWAIAPPTIDHDYVVTHVNRAEAGGFAAP